jgi:hypothetical protein
MYYIRDSKSEPCFKIVEMGILLSQCVVSYLWVDAMSGTVRCLACGRML